MNDVLGYVVLCWNQASGQPEIIAGTCPFPTRVEAAEVASVMRRETASVGRRERYTVASVECPQ